MNEIKNPTGVQVERIICGGSLLLILIHLVASYFPQERLWGVNLLFYMPPVWRWILVIPGLLILVPYINEKVGDFLRIFSRPITAVFKKLNRFYGYVFLSLIGGVLFWSFRVKTYLLGDSYMRAKEINMGANFSFTEPLDFLLHVKIEKLLSWDAFQVYAVMSVICGAAFLFLILLLGELWGRDGKERSFFFSIIVFMGASQLFFGYVESYTLVYVAIILYVLFCLGYIRNKFGLAFPILSFFLAFSLHPLALTLLPSLLYLIFTRRSQKNEPERKNRELLKFSLAAGVILVTAVVLFLLQSYNPERKGLDYFLIFPLGKGESFYSVFSFSHLLDIVNHQLLVSPVGILICLVSVLVFFRKINYKDRSFRFLLVLSICSLAYAFLMDPKLGYPRDWDLFAFTGLGYTLLGLYLFLKYWREIRSGDLRYVTLTLLFASLVSTVPWIYVNATEEKSVTRYGHLLTLDRGRSAHGYETLAMYYNTRGEWQMEIEQWMKAIAVENHPRYINNLAAVYYRQQRYDLALKELQRSLKVDSTFDYTHFGVGEVLSRMGRSEEALVEFRKAIKLRPDKVQYYNNLGAVLTNLGRDREALEVFEEGLKVNPDHFPIYRNLGYTYYNLGDFVSAEKYLKLYLERAPQAEDRNQVEAILRELKGKAEEY
jgi:tetratricopeptide (TPR) repeat protein